MLVESLIQKANTMYEFLSNTKDQNNSWSVNSSESKQVASPLPLAPTPGLLKSMHLT